MTTKTRPELGELAVGQSVVVRRSSNDMYRHKSEDAYIPARIVKASRVWIDLEYAGDDNCRGTWRMRRDTQDEGSQYSGRNARFATLDQHQWDITQTWARGVIEENGLTVERDSRWRGREAELAEILVRSDELTTSQ